MWKSFVLELHGACSEFADKVNWPVGITRDLAGLGEHLPLSRRNCVPPCNGCNQLKELGLYLAAVSSSDKTPLRYNVSNFLNSATTRIFPLGSASP